MYKFALYAPLAIATIALTGCTVYEQPGHGPRVYNDHYYYHDRDYDRDHCPPGHRRKHWC